jgi:phospholipid/cholesterol/gamma-HCH transport system substrate-binding protein
MNPERHTAEIYVGLFLAIGFAVIAVMVVKFGKLGRGLTDFYEITVQFPNASGLVKGADVLMAGARIGNAASDPFLVSDGGGYAVGVKLDIRADVKIPPKSRIVVGQSGLLGDVYVDVIPPQNFDPEAALEPGAEVSGGTKPGFGDLQKKGNVALESLQEGIEEMRRSLAILNSDVLNEENVKNITETFENLKNTSEELRTSAEKLDPIFDKADEAVDSARETMETTGKAAEDLRAAIQDFKKVADSADQTLASAREMMETGTRVLEKAEKGQGALGVLLSDPATADNLRALIANLRRSGPIFYKDREPKQVPVRRGQPAR